MKVTSVLTVSEVTGLDLFTVACVAEYVTTNIGGGGGSREKVITAVRREATLNVLGENFDEPAHHVCTEPGPPRPCKVEYMFLLPCLVTFLENANNYLRLVRN
jgi:hypothetical protein